MTTKSAKAFWAATLLAAVAALSVPAAQAGEVRAKIPFSFTVNQKTLPPGTYNVSNNSATLLVSGVHDGALAITNALLGDRSTGAKLVFHRYGDQYILREVWMGSGNGRVLPAPRMEREIASRSASAEFERVEIPLL